MTRLLLLFSLLAVLSISCVFSAVNPAQLSAPLATASPAPKSELAGAVSSEFPYPATVTADFLNIRTKPNHLSPLVEHVFLMQGEQVTVYSCTGLWSRINQDNAHPRFVNSLYLSEPCE